MLTSVAGIKQHIAQGINLLFFIPTCIVAIIINWRNGNIDKKVALVITASGVVGSIIGAIISTKLNVENLRRYFGIFLIIVAINEIYSLIKLYIKNKKANNKNEKNI